jgi:hypothetical protein
VEIAGDGNRTNPIGQNKGVTARFSIQLESNGVNFSLISVVSLPLPAFQSSQSGLNDERRELRSSLCSNGAWCKNALGVRPKRAKHGKAILWTWPIDDAALILWRVDAKWPMYSEQK